MIRTIFLFLMLSTSVNVSAISIIWTGSASTYWNNPANWSPQQVPQAGDDVNLYSGIIRIPHHFDAYAGSLDVFADAHLIVRSTAELFLDGTSLTNQIFIMGQLTNKGKIYCESSSGTNHTDIHIYDNGILSQTSSGKLYLHDFDTNGIINAGVFTNHGNVYTYGNNIGRYGITTLNGGILTNESSGRIYIYDVTDAGMGFTQNGTSISENNGLTYIYGNSTLQGILLLESEFHNNNYILVNSGSQVALKILISDVRNTGEINIAPSTAGGGGIFLNGTFVNTSTGELKVQNTGYTAVDIVEGTFTNGGTMTVFGSTGYHAIYNEAILVNEGSLRVLANASSYQIHNNGIIENGVCGYLEHHDTFHGSSYSDVYNQGIWVSYNTGSDLNNGSFENDGLIASPYGSFDAAGILNYGHYLGQISGNHCTGDLIEDALDLGSNPVMYDIIGCYTDSKYNYSAGSYDQVDNTLYLNSNSSQLDMLFLEVDRNNGYCTYRVPLGFENTIDDCNMYEPNNSDNLKLRETEDDIVALSLTAYPNPGSGELNLSLSGFTGSTQIQIFTSQGQLVFETRTNSAQMHQTYSPDKRFSKGLYIIRVSDEKGNEASEKWMVQ
ncbi:MAG: T9SS type A sorting domain-containing protein [Bacteroidetes bacterium]|nr:T9SS type A sorting domain-containing protein [Bacteroidota bacterium]